MRPNYLVVVDKLDLMSRLSDFSPILIGTPPLGIETTESDIDIACCSLCLSDFETFIVDSFSELDQLDIRKSRNQSQDSVIAAFQFLDWDIELFCQPIPTLEQWGVRHFLIEQRILSLAPRLANDMVRLKRSGMKTEPAFWKVLGLSGDPYSAILELEHFSDEKLLSLLERL